MPLRMEITFVKYVDPNFDHGEELKEGDIKEFNGEYEGKRRKENFMMLLMNSL